MDTSNTWSYSVNSIHPSHLKKYLLKLEPKTKKNSWKIIVFEWWYNIERYTTTKRKNKPPLFGFTNCVDWERNLIFRGMKCEGTKKKNCLIKRHVIVIRSITIILDQLKLITPFEVKPSTALSTLHYNKAIIYISIRYERQLISTSRIKIY